MPALLAVVCWSSPIFIFIPRLENPGCPCQQGSRYCSGSINMMQSFRDE